MKRSILGPLIGLVIGGIIFYPLSGPISLTIMLNMEGGPISRGFETADSLGWLIPLIGAIVGGVVGVFVGRKKLSNFLFWNPTATIIIWSSIIASIIGLGIASYFSWVILFGIGITHTSLDVWLFLGTGMAVGVVIGAVIGILIALIRLALRKIAILHSQVH